ncbi:MAG: thioredoxin family protein, partial [Bacteroidales bacterium]|nr:thioredoxin family protein [Bacteroidales bacterium]
GPIVGSVLIRSTGGEFWTPMVTMLAFSVAFALPFTLLAFFPSLLGKLKNGSWLNSVKIVLGFVEIALGFKFLSVADQTYHWGILDREVYLAIWIAVFTLLGLYLLGKIRFPHDDLPEKPLSVFRLGLVITVFSFVLYMLPGLWGAPLKALSGYLPPIETQDFVVTRVPPGIAGSRASRSEGQHPIALGLNAYYTIEEGLEASVREGKPVFVDITGHGCVNCREMEQRVWSRQDVFSLLRDSYIIVALYTDDKTALPEESWVTLDNGRVLKDMGRVNSWIVRQRFNVNAQPNYAILGSDGSLLLPVRGYNLDAEDFAAFLRSGLEIYGK